MQYKDQLRSVQGRDQCNEWIEC